MIIVVKKVYKKKVLLINTQMEKGGAQKALLTLASRLSRDKFEVYVATMYDKADFIPFYQEQYNLKIINLEMKVPEQSAFINLIRTVRGFIRIWNLLKKEQIEVVQSYSHYPNIIMPILAYFAGVKKRFTSQRMSLDYLSGTLQKLDKIVANSFFVTKIISVSEGTKDSCVNQGIKKDKIIVIPNGINIPTSYLTDKEQMDLKNNLGIAKDQFVITVVARLHRQKGHQYLLDALTNLKVQKDYIVFCVGDGDLMEELKVLVQQKQLQKNVMFLGSRNDVPAILQVSDLFILPSLWEGMPNSVLEAMAYGIPIIATNVDGTPELIKDEVHGKLILPKDSEELSAAITTLMTNGEMRLRLGENAQKRAREEFSIENTVSRYEQIYLT